MHARVLLVTTAASLALVTTAAAAPSDRYTVRNMVSNDTTIVPAERADPLLVNPWGLASSATSPWWPANQGSNTSTITPATNIPNATRANVPGGPTGVVAGPGGANFPIPGPPAGASNFIFNTLGGEIRAGAAASRTTTRSSGSRARASAPSTWASRSRRLRRRSVRGSTRPTSPTTGSTSSTRSGQLVDAPGAFVDPNLPAGYGAYGIQTVGNRIIVTYAARRLPAGIRERPGAGLGVVNAFDLNGNFLARVASPGGVLNAPWGTALAHAELRRLRRRPADRQLRRRPHQRVPRERQRHVDADAAR